MTPDEFETVNTFLPSHKVTVQIQIPTTDNKALGK